jgi:hypothetical protein
MNEIQVLTLHLHCYDTETNLQTRIVTTRWSDGHIYKAYTVLEFRDSTTISNYFCLNAYKGNQLLQILGCNSDIND